MNGIAFTTFVIGAVNVLALLGGLLRMQRIASRIEHTINYFAQEHELLMHDYAERHHIDLDKIPSRLEAAPWWRFS